MEGLPLISLFPCQVAEDPHEWSQKNLVKSPIFLCNLNRSFEVRRLLSLYLLLSFLYSTTFPETGSYGIVKGYGNSMEQGF